MQIARNQLPNDIDVMKALVADQATKLNDFTARNEQLQSWLDNTLQRVPPTGATGKALNYLHGEWDKLIRYLDDGRLESDNNGARMLSAPSWSAARTGCSVHRSRA